MTVGFLVMTVNKVIDDDDIGKRAKAGREGCISLAQQSRRSRYGNRSRGRGTSATTERRNAMRMIFEITFLNGRSIRTLFALTVNVSIQVLTYLFLS
jgi:hypothetical protein